MSCAAVSERSPGVLLIGNFLSGLGGRRSVCEELADRLSARGWRVVRASARVNRAARVWDMTRTAYVRRREYRVAQVDVFSGAAFRWAEAVCWVLDRISRPYVLTLHGGGLPEFAGRNARRVARLLSSAAAVTAPSSFLLDAMRPFRKDAILVPNAVDASSCAFRLRRGARPSLVWLRSFHRIYDPELAVRVFARVREVHADATLTMIGPDKGDGSLAQARGIAAELGVAPAVTFVPGAPKADVPRWLNRADVMLNTSRIDNTPVSVTEAMACGLCVVSTDAGGLRRLLRDGEDALLAPAEEGALSRAVLRVLSDARLSERLSCAARRSAEERDWSRVLPQWEALLERVSQAAACATLGAPWHRL